jgi:hypothetical protein
MTDDEARDPARDALALLRARIAGDDLGSETILDYADLRAVVPTLTGIIEPLLRERATLVLGLTDEDDIRACLDELLVRALAAKGDIPEIDPDGPDGPG